jgi:hypothetical protein
VGEKKKHHRFDLGASAPAALVECKSHTRTQSGNMPNAKLTVWNEAMYYFQIAPKHYRKIFFMLKHLRREISLATYDLAKYEHLIPEDVESESRVARRGGARASERARGTEGIRKRHFGAPFLHRCGRGEGGRGMNGLPGAGAEHGQWCASACCAAVLAKTG